MNASKRNNFKSGILHRKSLEDVLSSDNSSDIILPTSCPSSDSDRESLKKRKKFSKRKLKFAIINAETRVSTRGGKAAGVKRGSDGAPKCRCKSDCVRLRLCSCRKAGTICGEKCFCAGTCKNNDINNVTNGSNVNVSNDGDCNDTSDDSNNDSFKKPRPLSPLRDIENQLPVETANRKIEYD